jgi:serine/threonine protein kinase
MSQVYCATDTALGRPVAIKLLDDRYAGDPTTLNRFKREALAAARLSSDPNTITIFDVGERDGRLFIVMEYLPGGSVADVLASEGAQPISRSLEWLGQAAAALDHAHQHNVVHRDVKPSNLLLSDNQRVLVADFGVASAAGLESLTQTGTIIGTAGYLSPEQAQGLTATAASDRYGLGVVGFELIGGSRPFQRSSPTAEAAAHIREEIPALSERRSAIPAEVDRVFAQALAKEPRDRYSSCAEFVAALHAGFANAAESTRIIAPPSAMPVETRLIQNRRPPPPPMQRRRSKLGLLLASLLLLLVGGAALAAALVSHDRDSSAASQTARVTVTERGTTVIRTVTTRAPAATAAATTAPADTVSGQASGSSIALKGYSKMQAGDYADALPLLEHAARLLRGSRSLDEAYNDYNLALSLQRTQGCSSRVLQLLDASEAIQGHRAPILELRKACRK